MRLECFRALVFALGLGAVPATADAPPAAYLPTIVPASFGDAIDHPFYPLAPGTVYRYREREAGHVRTDIVTVTSETRTIVGVKCVVVHDRVTERGVVREDTFDWYAQDRDGNVWYFGEDTHEFGAHGRASTAGSWRAGLDGAQPGIAMPARPAPAGAYRQEYAPGRAEDMAQVESIRDSVTVPAGTFTGCVRTREWSPLEHGTERKWYARGVGLVRSESSSGEVLELLSAIR